MISTVRSTLGSCAKHARAPYSTQTRSQWGANQTYTPVLIMGGTALALGALVVLFPPSFDTQRPRAGDKVWTSSS